MKDSKEYSKRLRKLYRSLKRKYPRVEKLVYDEPTEALVYATLSEHISEASARAAAKRFEDYFVDMNDMRVSRPEEIIEALGAETGVARDTALVILRVFGAIFTKYNTASLEALKKVSKRQAKQLLFKLDGVSRFAVNYCMQTSLQGHGIALTEKMLEYLRANELVDPEADERQIEGFLARQVSAEDGYEFYALLRAESERGRARRGRKTSGKTKKRETRRMKK
jgi:endonuclease III